MATNGELATAVRLRVMDIVRDRGQVPNAAEVAAGMDQPVEEIVRAFRRLHEAHVFVLEPGKHDELRMVNPFSAVPTPFSVEIAGRGWWGNCIWDGLGIIAAMGGSGTLTTGCPDCGETQAVRVEGAKLRKASGTAFVGVPARAWWNDIIHT